MDRRLVRINAPRESNLDSSGMVVVRKNCLVSYGGLRLRVWKVRTGHFIGFPVTVAGREVREAFETFPCRAVRVLS